jgi:serine/threonine protein kinase
VGEHSHDWGRSPTAEAEPQQLALPDKQKRPRRKTLQLVPGDRLGRFEIRGELGAGGMGVVYAAYDDELERIVALKTLRNLDVSSLYPAQLYAFKREFRALADVTHPNLVQLYELGSVDDQWFFTMEAVEGTDPLTFIRAGYLGSSGTTPQFFRYDPTQPIPAAVPLTSEEQFARLRDVLRQIAEGISALHGAGKVHRDVKPSNVLVTDEGRAVLLDFGLIADATIQKDASDVTVVGTAAYMAPEQAAGRAVGSEADWYSFGVLLFEALTGEWPFVGAPIRMLMSKQHEEAPRVSGLVPDIPDDLDYLCARLLDGDPCNRPTDEEVLDFLGGRGDEISIRGHHDSSGEAIFVGRVDEVATLFEHFNSAINGEAIATFIKGESGVGKSTLAHHFISLVKETSANAVVLSGRCFERESVPYKAFDGIVDALSQFLKRIDPIEAALLLPEDAALLGQLFPVLRRVPVVARMPAAGVDIRSPNHLRSRGFAALRVLLTRIGRRWPLLLFVDDFQWADGDSLALLSEVFHGSDAPKLLLLATVRARDELPAAIEQSARDLEQVRTVRLTALSRTESVRLARKIHSRLTGATASDGLCMEIADEANGHPLYIDELIRYLCESGSEPDVMRLDEALLSRVRQLPDDARRLLDVVVVAGSPLPLETAAAAARISGSDWSTWANVLCVANMVRTTGSRGTDTIEAYHDRVRDAVLGRLDNPERIEIHRLIADELQAAGIDALDPHVLVRHLAAAGETTRAARLAEEAALRAQNAFAFDHAAELYRDALRLGAEHRSTKLGLALAETLRMAGRGPEAAEVSLEVAKHADAATRLDCQRLAAEQLLLAGHVERGFAALETVIADGGVRVPATPKRALSALVWQRLRLRLRGLKWSPRDESQIAPTDLNRLDVYAAIASSMSIMDNIKGAYFQARSLRLALELGEPARIVQALAIESFLLGSQGGRARVRSRKLVREVVRVGDQSGKPILGAWAVAARGFEHHFHGRFRQAVERLLDAERMIHDFGMNGFELSSIRIFRLIDLRFLGRLRELKKEFEDTMRDARRRGDRYLETTLTCALNTVWLMGDEPERARNALEQRLWSPLESAFHIQHWYALRGKIQVDLYASNAPSLKEYESELAALERSQLLRVQVIRSEYMWLLGRMALAGVAAGAADSKRSIRSAEKLGKKLLREGICYADVFGRFLLAGARATAGDDAGAIEHLRAAADVAESHDLALFHAAARRRLGELGASRSGEDFTLAADQWMRSETIRNPAKMTEMLLPGFDD